VDNAFTFANVHLCSGTHGFDAAAVSNVVIIAGELSLAIPRRKPNNNFLLQ